jgi:hypothetical protein
MHFQQYIKKSQYRSCWSNFVTFINSSCAILRKQEVAICNCFRDRDVTEEVLKTFTEVQSTFDTESARQIMRKPRKNFTATSNTTFAQNLSVFCVYKASIKIVWRTSQISVTWNYRFHYWPLSIPNNRYATQPDANRIAFGSILFAE